MRMNRPSALAAVTALLAAAVAQTGVSTAGVSTAAPAAAPVKLNVSDTFIVEHAAGKAGAAVVLALTKSLDAPVTVQVTTANGSATAPADYEAVDQVVEFAAGEYLFTLEIPVVPDSDPEAEEDFTVTLSDATGVTLGDAVATVLIVDDDSGAAPVRDCDDANAYTTDTYSESLGYCTHTLVTTADLDGDRAVGAWVGGADCDDSDPAVAPRFADVPGDGIDNNCDGLVDGVGTRDCDDGNPYTKDRYKANKARCTTEVLTGSDLDADTYVAAWVGGPDCDDADASVHPGATEADDGVDSDCDGLDVDGPVPPTEASVRTFDSVGEPQNCPPSAACQAITVDCEGLPTARASIALSLPAGPARGVLVMFLGSEGTGFYDGDDQFVPSLSDEGFVMARINWLDGWNNSYPSGPYGLSTAACRTATLVEHLHETEYLPLELDLADMVCGFCVTGNSAGALQAGYLLADYGLESILDAVVMGGGPIPTRIAEACLEPGGDDTYAARDTVVDYAYGANKGEKGPCALMDASMEETWRADSLVDGGDDFFHPHTRASIYIGGLDQTSAPAHATDYYDKLVEADSPYVSYDIIATAGHGLSEFLSDPAAQAAITAEFLWAPPHPTRY